MSLEIQCTATINVKMLTYVSIITRAKNKLPENGNSVSALVIHFSVFLKKQPEKLL